GLRSALARRIRAGVVDHDYDVDEARNAPEHSPDEPLFVPRRDDDGDAFLRPHGLGRVTRPASAGEVWDVTGVDPGKIARTTRRPGWARKPVRTLPQLENH